MYNIEMAHSVVVYPESTEDVVEIVKIAVKYKIPITPYSGATALEGQYRGVRHRTSTRCFRFVSFFESYSIPVVEYASI